MENKLIADINHRDSLWWHKLEQRNYYDAGDERDAQKNPGHLNLQKVVAMNVKSVRPAMVVKSNFSLKDNQVISIRTASNN